MKNVKIFSLIILLFFVVSCSSPDEVDVNNPNNLPDYVAFLRGESGPGYERINDVYLVSGKKAKKYKKNDSNTMLNYAYDKYDKKVYAFGHVDCTVKSYDKNLNTKQFDLCNIKNVPKTENGFVTDAYITKDYIATYLNGGFTENGYDNIIRVVDKDFNFVKDIKTNDLVLSYVMIDNYIYYVSGKANDYESEKIMKYNIKTNEEEVYYENKDKKVINDVLVSDKKIYITIGVKDGKSDVAVYKNNKLTIIKKAVNFIIYNKYDSNYFMYVKYGNSDNYEENKAGILSIKNNKVTVSPKNCQDTYYITDKYFYCKLDNDYFDIIDTKTYKTKRVKIPFPSPTDGLSLVFFE